MDAKDFARAEIRKLLNGRVPEAVNNGGYETAVDYKAAVSAANRAVNARNSTLMSLQEALATLKRFA